ncbi:carboxypeptidase-like regulatory domain-containing protein [Acinetobacter bereziniae]|uniref:carboxypeptidase-like regulatory domain-containing protein n=1 Tax=Acinetobacter bereziniae TaxID=106648 RepID=UPI00124DAA85|nr:carboxypeptidase-like regulatory domain-containing protein [Acinetobacter bereziniae]MDA3441401.1 carboxypeptidase-like regulatory domain-containing protein [Acinetobacter bereziniae]
MKRYKKVIFLMITISVLAGCGGGGEGNQNIDGAVWSTSGKVIDDAGNPIAGAEVSVKLNDVKYSVKTDNNGNYRLKTPQDYDYPQFFAGIIKADHYKPVTVLFSYTNNHLGVDTKTSNPTLKKLQETDIIFFNGLDIIHLGDNQFTGSVNSQLQIKAQGKVWIDHFIYSDLLKSKYDNICISFMGRGFNSIKDGSNDPISLSNNGQPGTYIVKILPDSAENGSFSQYKECFSLSSFKAGDKIQLQINSLPKNGDFDDFEMINMFGELSGNGTVVTPPTTPDNPSSTGNNTGSVTVDNHYYPIDYRAPIALYPNPSNGLNSDILCAVNYAALGPHYEYLKPNGLVSGSTEKARACSNVKSNWPSFINFIQNNISNCQNKSFEGIYINAIDASNLYSYSTTYTLQNPIDWIKVSKQLQVNYQSDVDLCNK